MTQVSISSFHTVRLALVEQRCVCRVAVDQFAIRRAPITEVRLRLRCLIDHSLKRIIAPCFHDGPPDNTMRGSVDRRYDIDNVVFSPIKVNSSSSSTVSVVVGAGGVSGMDSVAALTQLMTVW
jgi:hypothetical protein